MLRENMLGKVAAGNAAHMDFEQFVGMGGAGEREGATLVVLEQKLDVLAGEELQPLVGRQLEADDHHVIGHAFELLHAAGQDLDWNVAGGADFAHFERQVGEWLGAAEQRHAGGAILGGERMILCPAVIDLAFQNLALAGAAGAILAAVGQIEAGVERGFENGAIGCNAESVAAGLEGDLVGHAIIVR